MWRVTNTRDIDPSPTLVLYVLPRPFRLSYNSRLTVTPWKGNGSRLHSHDFPMFVFDWVNFQTKIAYISTDKNRVDGEGNKVSNAPLQVLTIVTP